MRLRALPFVLMLATSGPLLGQASTAPLSEADLAALVTLGRANKLNGLVTTCTARKPSTGMLVGMTGVTGAIIQGASNSNNVFRVSLMTARGRVASSAWAATQKQHSFTPADIAAADRQPGLWIVAEPRMPDADEDAILPAKIQSIDIRSKLPAGDQVMKSDEDVASETLTWKNDKGATVDYQRATAHFSGRRLQSLDLEAATVIAVQTEAGARVCEMNPGELGKILRAKK